MGYMRRMNSAGRCSIRRATTRTTTPRVWPTKGRTIRSFLPLVSLHGPKRKRFYLAVQNSSIGDLVTNSLTQSLLLLPYKEQSKTLA